MNQAQTAKPLVSVITPVYNEEKYLAACIESVLAQTYAELEYIVLDNQSKDGSLALARAYAERDPRVKVIAADTFRDQAANHNYALTLLSEKSRYCKVVLGDDWIYPECLERMVAVAEAHPRAGIVSSYWLAGKNVMGSGFPIDKAVLPGAEVCRMQLVQGLFFFGSPSTLLLRSEIVRARNPFYIGGSPHSDTEACYEILKEWEFGFVPQVLTVIRTENISLSSPSRRFSPNNLDKFIIVRKYAHFFLEGEALAACRRRSSDRYFSFLADSLFPRREKAFWDYHRRGLALVGVTLGWRQLWRPAAMVILDMVFNPKKALGRYVKRPPEAVRA